MFCCADAAIDLAIARVEVPEVREVYLTLC